MRKVKFIYNPSSGETRIGGLLDDIVAIYQRADYLPVLYRLDFQGDPARLFEDLDERYDHLLVAGGDGSVNFVVDRMRRHGVDIPVAVLPTGTANDFATLLGMPSDPLAAVRTILNGEQRRIDLGEVNDRLFVNVFSCGLFTDVSQRTPTAMKNAFGKLAYYMNGLGELPKFRKMNLRIESDGGNFEGSSLIFFVFNGRTAGNLKLACGSEIDDGLLDVVIVRGERPLGALQSLIHYIGPFRRGGCGYPKDIVHLQASRLTACSERDETTDVDGQPGPRFPLEIRCRHHALRVIVAGKK